MKILVACEKIYSAFLYDIAIELDGNENDVELSKCLCDLVGENDFDYDAVLFASPIQFNQDFHDKEIGYIDKYNKILFLNYRDDKREPFGKRKNLIYITEKNRLDFFKNPGEFIGTRVRRLVI